MARKLDFTNETAAGVMKRLLMFVRMDLRYHKDHADLQMRALDWDAHDRPRARLLVGNLLTAKRRWLTDADANEQQPRPTDLQREYVRVSRAAARRQSALLRGLAALAVLLMCVAAAAAMYQWRVAESSLAEAKRQRAEAQRQEALAIQTAAEATVALLVSAVVTDTNINGYPQAAMLRALRHDNVSEDTQVVLEHQARLLSSTTQNTFFPAAILKGHSDWVNSVAQSPDGTWLASGSGDNDVRVWTKDTDGSWSSRILAGHSNSVTSVARSPDGTRLASGSDDGDVR
eukprot:769569-Pyramimonas_sp.AAC.1